VTSTAAIGAVRVIDKHGHEVKKRRLPSLEGAILAYSIKVWYQHPPARTYHGVDPNAPREPGYFGPKVRLAARVVDEKTGGNPANLGICDCDPCDCAFAPGKYVPCEHDRICPHDGATDEEERQVSERLRALMNRLPTLAAAFLRGIAAVYQLADLTPGETDVAKYRHEGLSYTSIAFVTGRQVGTVKALDSRGHSKLRSLVVEKAVANPVDDPRHAPREWRP
jgi:hypothetical protein